MVRPAPSVMTQGENARLTCQVPRTNDFFMAPPDVVIPAQLGTQTLEYGSPLARIGADLRVLVQRVMRGLDPRIHLLRKKVFAKMDGLHRNSGLPELRSIMRRKAGKPDLRCQARQ
jgi:hypothetical protein